MAAQNNNILIELKDYLDDEDQKALLQSYIDDNETSAIIKVFKELVDEKLEK